MMRELFGMKVTVSDHAVIEFQKAVGIADKRRPNTRRPFYRMVTRRKYPIYLVQGNVICHQSVAAAMIAEIEKQERSLFTTAPAATFTTPTLTMEKMTEMIKSMPKPAPNPWDFLHHRPEPIMPDPDPHAMDTLRMSLLWRSGAGWQGTDKAVDTEPEEIRCGHCGAIYRTHDTACEACGKTNDEGES